MYTKTNFRFFLFTLLFLLCVLASLEILLMKAPALGYKLIKLYSFSL